VGFTASGWIWSYVEAVVSVRFSGGTVFGLVTSTWNALWSASHNYYVSSLPKKFKRREYPSLDPFYGFCISVWKLTSGQAWQCKKHFTHTVVCSRVAVTENILSPQEGDRVCLLSSTCCFSHLIRFCETFFKKYMLNVRHLSYTTVQSNQQYIYFF